MQPHPAPHAAPGPAQGPISEADVAQRLDFLQLDPAGLEQIRKLAPTLEPAVEPFVGDFYDHLEQFPELARLIGTRRAALQETQTAYFKNLLEGEVDWGYVERRLNVGKVHDMVGLPLKWYSSTFARYVLGVLTSLRPQLEAGGDETWEGLQALIRLIFFDMSLAVDSYVHAREQRLESQQRALRELSAPVIEVWKGILVLPLVGSVDTYRAHEVTEALLTGVDQHQAEVAIIDITGLPVMDTSTANHLITTVRAVELLGARVIVTGVRPAIAQTIVGLGIDTSSLTTKSRLAEGLRLALSWTGQSPEDDERG